jgi:hypothetical protein
MPVRIQRQELLIASEAFSILCTPTAVTTYTQITNAIKGTILQLEE